MRFEEEEINKREKRENHAQHNTNINDARSLKVLKMRVLFFKDFFFKKGVTFSAVFLKRVLRLHALVSFERYLNT